MGKTKVSLFFSNLWYYHKWKIIAGAFMLLVLAVTITQCINKDNPDIRILYVGDFDIGEESRTGISKQFRDYYEDTNGDEKKQVAVTFMGTNDKDTKERLQIEVIAGNHQIYCLSKEYYELLLPYNIFAPLKDVLGTIPEGAVGDYGIELKYLDIAETVAFGTMARNTIVCLRANVNDGGFNYETATPSQKSGASFFIKLVNHKIEDFSRVDINMVMIGDRTLYENCVSDIEHSIYYVATKQNDKNHAPILNYDFMQLKYKEGQHIFGSEEKQQVEELVKGDKLLLLDIDAYVYLAEKQLLLDVKTLGVQLPDASEQYGAMFTELSISNLDGFYFADDKENNRLYLCASKDASEYTKSVLGYLYEFKS